MIELDDYQFEYEGVVFGIGTALSVDAEGFNPGVNSFTSQDVENGFTDSISMGRDSVAPSEWTFEAFTTGDTPAEARAAIRALGRVWNDPELRRAPGEVRPLRYCIDGETRVVFGRPREFGQTLSNKILHGEIPLELHFQPADTLSYADEEVTLDVLDAPVVTDGFTTPFTTPLLTKAAAPVSGSLPAFDGDIAVPLAVTFTGPALNPRIYTTEWQLGLSIALAEGESVTIETYPWNVRTLRADGVRMPGVMSTASRPSLARLRPQGETIRFHALDSSGTASCQIRFRPANTTI